MKTETTATSTRLHIENGKAFSSTFKTKNVFHKQKSKLFIFLEAVRGNSKQLERKRVEGETDGIKVVTMETLVNHKGKKKIF